jgi:peptidoglycan/LPS O-acetylase OafA/YrhL
VAVFLGAVSYGLYLWHQIFLSAPRGVGYVLRAFDWPLFDAPLVPVFALATVGGVACGAASWYLVEKPILDRYR